MGSEGRSWNRLAGGGTSGGEEKMGTVGGLASWITASPPHTMAEPPSSTSPTSSSFVYLIMFVAGIGGESNSNTPTIL
jgi:hypothetical protein